MDGDLRAAASFATQTKTATVSTSEASTTSTSTRQRKKRKWDQPAEDLMSIPGMVSGFSPLSKTGALGGMNLPALMGMLPGMAASSALQSASQIAAVPQNAAAIVQKINQDLCTKGLMPQLKIQDELIAREIVINDAESGIRYKLTKRQTQEEIQVKTGAVVITRGRYRPPNGPIDNEKPLYLHISAGVHYIFDSQLKDTAERIKAVDHAAAIVEEMLKQGRHAQIGLLSSGGGPLTAVVYVGLEVDGNLNLLNRIRGPNDQYINHIMNETGVTVILRGRGTAGNASAASTEAELNQPLHLFISSDNSKSVDDARRLAENLLETVRSDYLVNRPSQYPPVHGMPAYSCQTVVPYGGGLYPAVTVPGQPFYAPRPSVAPLPMLGGLPIVPGNVYTAVPPPKQLVSDSESAAVPAEPSAGMAASSSESSLSSCPNTLSCFPQPTAYSQISSACTAPQVQQWQSYGQAPVSNTMTATISGTNYAGYNGLYPQASPLQQVAMALQRPPPLVSAKLGSAMASIVPPIKAQATPGLEKHQEKQLASHRRKFQEFPASGKELPKDDQLQSNLYDLGGPQRISVFPTSPPKSMPTSLSKTMLPPPPKSMPPPPPKTNFTAPVAVQSTTDNMHGTTVLKLVEYAEEDDDDQNNNELPQEVISRPSNGKPFWAP